MAWAVRGVGSLTSGRKGVRALVRERLARNLQGNPTEGARLAGNEPQASIVRTTNRSRDGRSKRTSVGSECARWPLG
jgi:hypothetical protein